MAKKAPPVVLTFAVEDVDAVVAVMGELASPAAGWLTLQPGFDAEQSPPPRRWSGFFTARGPYIPVATWVPGERTRQGVDYIAVGLQHGFGGAVASWLAEQRLGVPSGWEVMSDHPSRGLVVAVPPAADHETVLRWLLDAADRLCPVQLTGEWRATVHRH
jgi:hypothetical protein